jgi:hypothetical protein
MGEAKHTPGPWKVTKSSERKTLCVVNDDTWICGELQALNGTAIDERECLANARLIAAAPEMYEALEQAEACMSIVEPRSDKAEYLRILGVIRAVIGKAEGRQPSAQREE